MKNRNSIYQGLSRASIGMLAACMTLTACDKDQEFTPAMPEAKLINGITFKVSENLPLAIGMDSTIVFAMMLPKNWKIVPLSGSQPTKLLPKFHSKALLPV
jgi:hypothetical protein